MAPHGRTGRERSVFDLAQIDVRNEGLVRINPDRTLDAISVEDVQADFLRAESILGPNVPDKIRQRIAVARNLAAYGWFSYEFYAVAVFWSLSCLEMALRMGFAEKHSGTITLTNSKLRASEVVPSWKAEERLRTGWREGWRMEGLPTFNFSFRSLLGWVREAGYWVPEANPKWILKLRNSMAHPSDFNWVLPPGDALSVFGLVVEVVGKLWPE